MSNVKNQMSNVNKVKLLSERTSGVPSVVFELNGIEIAQCKSGGKAKYKNKEGDFA